MYTAKQTGILCSGSCNPACHNVSFLLNMVYWVGYWLGINHVQFPAGAKEFSVLQCRMALGPTQPAVQWVLRAKWLGHEAECLPPASDKIHAQWVELYLYSPPHVSMVCTGAAFYIQILRSVNLKTGEKHAFVTPVNSELAKCNIV
jgi:hypothetical protein